MAIDDPPTTSWTPSTATRADRAPGARRRPALGDAAVALTLELVAIDSVNPGLVPGAAGEAAVVEHLRNRLQGSGFETHVITPAGHDHRPSLVAIGPGEPTGPTVVLTGHLDTVGVEGMPHPFTPAVDGDRLTGRGSSDMKGGVAAMVVAAEELVRRAAPGRVVLALVADEEDASLGAEAVLAALPGLGVHPDVAVVGEPTWLALTASLRGYALVEVTLAGRAAHSSQPELGVNAVGPPRSAPRGRRAARRGARGGRCLADGDGRLGRRLALRARPLGPGAGRAPHDPGRALRRRGRRGRAAARRPACRRPHGRGFRPARRRA